jgi:hypothetical protein
MSAGEPVGSLAEEAAKLFAAIQAWAGDHEEPAEGSHPHVDPASAECRWCPLCQVVRMARATSPDVREHLSQAALSLALAVRGLLEDSEGTARRAAPVEKIDLTEE